MMDPYWRAAHYRPVGPTNLLNNPLLLCRQSTSSRAYYWAHGKTG
jgi:hypothetical protein